MNYCSGSLLNVQTGFWILHTTHECLSQLFYGSKWTVRTFILYSSSWADSITIVRARWHSLKNITHNSQKGNFKSLIFLLRNTKCLWSFTFWPETTKERVNRITKQREQKVFPVQKEIPITTDSFRLSKPSIWLRQKLWAPECVNSK